MSQHHPSCKPSDRDLVWLCAQCGGHESAESLEADTKRLEWLEAHEVEIVMGKEVGAVSGNFKTLREAIDAAMKRERV